MPVIVIPFGPLKWEACTQSLLLTVTAQSSYGARVTSTSVSVLCFSTLFIWICSYFCHVAKAKWMVPISNSGVKQRKQLSLHVARIDVSKFRQDFAFVTGRRSGHLQLQRPECSIYIFIHTHCVCCNGIVALGRELQTIMLSSLLCASSKSLHSLSLQLHFANQIISTWFKRFWKQQHT